jgi:hypothetical protein
MKSINGNTGVLKIEAKLLFGDLDRINGADGCLKILTGFLGRFILAARAMERLKIANIDDKCVLAVHALE